MALFQAFILNFELIVSPSVFLLISSNNNFDYKFSLQVLTFNHQYILSYFLYYCLGFLRYLLLQSALYNDFLLFHLRKSMNYLDNELKYHFLYLSSALSLLR